MGSEAQTKGFAGYERQGPKAWTYQAGARMYNAQLGRFLSPDPLGGGAANPYTYVADNPLTLTDPTGMCIAGSWSGPGSCPQGVNIAASRRDLQPYISHIAFEPVPPGFDGYDPVIPETALMEMVGGEATGALKAAMACALLCPIAVEELADALGGIDCCTLFSDGGDLEDAVREKAIEEVQKDPNKLIGAEEADIEDIIPDGWIADESARGGGIRYINPASRGSDAVRVMPGNPSDSNPVKRGPYVRITYRGDTSDPIPMKGNPTLP